MTAPLYNPGQPYMQSIPGGFSAGKIAHLTGTFTSNATSFVVKLQSGPRGDPNDDIGLCLFGRLNERILGMNAFTRHAGWGQEEAFQNPAFVSGQPFELTILSEPSCFKIAINGQHWGQFSHRTDPSSLSYFNIASSSSDLNVSCVWIEDPARPSQQTPYPASPMGGTPYPTGNQSMPYPEPPVGQQNYNHHSSAFPSKSGKGLLGTVGAAGTALAGALGASHLLGGKSKGYPSQSPAGYPSGFYPGQPQYGSYGGQPQCGSYPGQPQCGSYGGQPQYGGYPAGHKSGSSGMLGKAMALGGGVLGAKAMSKGVGGGFGKKAMKYGIPLGAAGLGGYALSKGLGGSFDGFDGFGGSCSDCSDSD